MHDAALAESLATRRIVLENCPSSNLCTGALAKQTGKPNAALADHPLEKFLEGGSLVTLSTDDPAMFHTDLLTEYSHAASTGLSKEQLLQLAEQSFQRAFLPPTRSANCSTTFARRQNRRACYNRSPPTGKTMKAHVWVMLKSTVLDPQGQTIQRALSSLGYAKVEDVRQGKFFVLQLDGLSRAELKLRSNALRRMSSRIPLSKNFASKSSISFHRRRAGPGYRPLRLLFYPPP